MNNTQTESVEIKCKDCSLLLPGTSYNWWMTNGKLCHRVCCRDCHAKREWAYEAKRGRGFKIYKFHKGNDKKKGMSNDLTIEFIESEISNPCHYCGTVKENMTLDRIDNSIGHLQSNCVPCCLSCNTYRRSMPYEAFVILVNQGLKAAKESGLLDEWTWFQPKPTYKKGEGRFERELI